MTRSSKLRLRFVRTAGNRDLWALQLGDAKLRLSEPIRHPQALRLPFDVIAHATLSLEAEGSHGYRGRSHSLWYCDATDAGRFSWYEMAFMETLSGGGSIKPFALTPAEAGIAFSHTMGTK
jgi:serine/threonine-protein kinase